MKAKKVTTTTGKQNPDTYISVFNFFGGKNICQDISHKNVLENR